MNKKKGRLASLLFIILLLGFTTYVLLDTFVIPEKGVKVENETAQEESDSNSTSDSTSTDNSDATITDTSYEDDNISITITTKRVSDTTVYIADVQVSDISYLKTAFAEDTYGRNIKETTSDIAENHSAILAINGDYYGFRHSGFVLRNGVIYRDTAQEDTQALSIMDDGTFQIVDEDSVSLSSLLDEGATQVLSFGPALITDGEISVTEGEEVDRAMSSNPRTAIGVISPLHYVFVVSDGRTDESDGLSLSELAGVMDDLGCTTAYNLDGGGSSTMYFNGEVVNQPTSGHGIGERSVSDIVYIG